MDIGTSPPLHSERLDIGQRILNRYVQSVPHTSLRNLFLTALLVSSLGLASCGDDSDNQNSVSPQDTAPDTPINLSSICPETVVIQTDWWPQAEHGFVYQLLGDNYSINTDQMSVRGPLVVSGQSTGVNLQINAGGPAVGFDPVISRMYSKPEILLAFMGTDIALSKSEEFPTVAVVAPFNINPQIIMWDPATYPNVRSISDLKDANVTVLYFPNVAYMTYLTDTGILNSSQVEGTYDGFPEQFISANGAVAQQGFGTNEPIFYETKLEQWQKPLRYQYLHEIGWTPYAQSLAVTPAKKQTYDSCLAKLVPMIQQAQYDYVLNPARTNEVIVDVVQTLNPTTQYDLDLAMASADKQLTDALVSNSADGALGSFDIERVEDFLKIAAPIYITRGDKVKQPVTANDLVTNEYIDQTISLPRETAR